MEEEVNLVVPTMVKLAVLVVVLVDILQLVIQDHQMHLLTEFHQPLKVMQVVLLLAIMVVLVVVVPVLPVVILQQMQVVMVVLDCQIPSELAQVYSMLVAEAALVMDRALVQEEMVAAVKVDQEMSQQGMELQTPEVVVEVDILQIQEDQVVLELLW